MVAMMYFLVFPKDMAQENGEEKEWTEKSLHNNDGSASDSDMSVSGSEVEAMSISDSEVEPMSDSEVEGVCTGESTGN